jgi:TRAP-type uncharacterized transport system fused permease subunit
LLALTSCYVPFAIIFNPELVLMPWLLSKTPLPFPYLDYCHAIITTGLGVVALGALIVGYFGDRAKVSERIFLLFILFKKIRPSSLYQWKIKEHNHHQKNLVIQAEFSEL